MDITSLYTSGTSSSTTGSSTVRNVNSEMGKEAFLQILVTQLSNQDPMNPMEDKDFIGQLAQFSVLEELQNLNTGATFSQASGMVGKNIYTTITAADGTAQEIYGRVTCALTMNGEPFLEVNGQYVPYNQNIVVYDYVDPLTPAAGDQTITVET